MARIEKEMAAKITRVLAENRFVSSVYALRRIASDRNSCSPSRFRVIINSRRNLAGGTNG